MDIMNLYALTKLSSQESISGLRELYMKNPAENILVHIHRVSIELRNGLSSTSKPCRAILRMGDWDIIDAKFIDENEMLMIISDKSKQNLYGCYQMLALTS